MRRAFALGVVVILVGLGFVFPQVANWRMQAGVEPALLCLGLAMTAGGVASLLYGVKLMRT